MICLGPLPAWLSLCRVHASSGQPVGHRLSRAATGKSTAPCIPSCCTAANTTRQPGRNIEQRLAEGKSRRDATRCLKRYLARNLYRLLENGAPQTT